MGHCAARQAARTVQTNDALDVWSEVQPSQRCLVNWPIPEDLTEVWPRTRVEVRKVGLAGSACRADPSNDDRRDKPRSEDHQREEAEA